MKKFFERILAKLGYVPFSEKQSIMRVNADLKDDNRILGNRNTQLMQQNEQLQNQVKNLPFDFTALESRWNVKQKNALMYRFINDVRNSHDPEDREYIKIWYNRLEQVVEEMKPKNQINS